MFFKDPLHSNKVVIFSLGMRLGIREMAARERKICMGSGYFGSISMLLWPGLFIWRLSALGTQGEELYPRNSDLMPFGDEACGGGRKWECKQLVRGKKHSEPVLRFPPHSIAATQMTSPVKGWEEWDICSLLFLRVLIMTALSSQ